MPGCILVEGSNGFSHYIYANVQNVSCVHMCACLPFSVMCVVVVIFSKHASNVVKGMKKQLSLNFPLSLLICIMEHTGICQVVRFV
jgi:hypothetical protein